METGNCLLTFDNTVHDRLLIYVDNEFVGGLNRNQFIQSQLLKCRKGGKLSLLVENQGRIGFGWSQSEYKGIKGDVYLNGNAVENWTQVNPLPKTADMLEQFQMMDFADPSNQTATSPAIYVASFAIPQTIGPADSFLRLDGWGKGVAYLNGFNLGRYWPTRGPQVTLYAPISWFTSEHLNYIALFETDSNPCSDGNGTSCVINWVVDHVINGTIN